MAVKSRRKFSQVGSSGMNDGGWAKTSAGGLNEVETIQKKGKAAWRARSAAPTYRRPRVESHPQSPAVHPMSASSRNIRK